MDEKEFICPICQELTQERIPMRHGVYIEMVGRKKYFVVRGGLVCTKNTDHHIGEDRYRLLKMGEISHQRILYEMREAKDGHLTERLWRLLGRGK
jgi:hypothetical protein